MQVAKKALMSPVIPCATEIEVGDQVLAEWEVMKFFVAAGSLLCSAKQRSGCLCTNPLTSGIEGCASPPALPPEHLAEPLIYISLK